MKWIDQECRRIRDQDQEVRRSQGDQESRRIRKARDWKCQCAGSGFVEGISEKQLYVADWHKSNVSMCALANRFP